MDDDVERSGVRSVFACGMASIVGVVVVVLGVALVAGTEGLEALGVSEVVKWLVLGCLGFAALVLRGDIKTAVLSVSGREITERRTENGVPSQADSPADDAGEASTS